MVTFKRWPLKPDCNLRSITKKSCPILPHAVYRKDTRNRIPMLTAQHSTAPDQRRREAARLSHLSPPKEKQSDVSPQSPSTASPERSRRRTDPPPAPTAARERGAESHTLTPGTRAPTPPRSRPAPHRRIPRESGNGRCSGTRPEAPGGAGSYLARGRTSAPRAAATDWAQPRLAQRPPLPSPAAAGRPEAGLTALHPPLPPLVWAAGTAPPSFGHRHPRRAVWVGRTSQPAQPHPCRGMGAFITSGCPGRIQPGPEHLWGRGAHSSLGSPNALLLPGPGRYKALHFNSIYPC